MGSEAVEDCVQGALSSLYPPFESTAPPLLSQVFSVLESTYQHDSLRYLLDFFIPAKHLLHRLQQHACSQYLGCLFLHSGWPLCLGEKVVVQLSTLDWRLLRSTDFYLQVVPFSTRCPRLALKCLAPGGRNVQEVLVPESQHPLVFTAEWLHCINKERGCKREGGGCLDTCLVSTCDGVVRISWDEVVYPKLLHNPSDALSNLEHPSADSPAPNYLSPTTGGLGLGWGSSSGEADSWSWDEEDDLPPDGGEAEIESALGRLRQDQLAADGSGDYVELLEPRGGPDGGADPKQRYLEMHGICKTKTLPLCRRSKAIRLRKGKVWGYGRTDATGRTGSLGRRDSNNSRGRTGSLIRRDSNNSGKESGGTRRDWANSRPLPQVIDLARERRPCPPCLQDSDEGGTDPVGLESRGLYLKGPVKERRPGVGKEREGAVSTLPWEESHKGRVSNSRRSSGVEEINKVDIHTAGNAGADQSDQDQGLQSDSVFKDNKSLAGTLDGGHKASAESANAGTQKTDTAASDSRRPLTNGSETKLNPLKDSSCNRESNSTSTKLHSTTKESGNSKDETRRCNEHRKPEGNLSQPGTDSASAERRAGKSEERVCPRGKEVKVAGFRAPRRKRKGKGKGKGKSGGRVNHKSKGDSSPSKTQNKTNQVVTTSDPTAKPSLSKDTHSEETNKLDQDSALTNGKEAEPESTDKSGEKLEGQPESLKDGETQPGTSLPDHSTEEEGASVPSDQSKGQSSTKASPLLRDLDVDLLQSGKFILTGTVDRLGRGLVITETHAPEEGHLVNDIVQLLSCYYAITRPAAKEKGLTVLVDSRQAPPSELCISALKLFKAQVPAALGSVLILTKEEQESATPSLDGIEVHSVRGTGVLQQYVDRQQLTKGLDGDFEHSHADWLTFRLSLEQLTERCESALSLLGDALQSMDTEPLPDCIKSVPLSVDKHKQLMSNVLADERLTELQRRGGAWLAGLANGTSGLAQRSPDCRAALATTSNLYDSVDDALHRLVRVSNQRGHDLEALGRLATLVGKLDKCEKEIERVQEQLEEYKDPPLSLSRLSLKQQKFKSFRESAMELHSETLVVLGEVESWSELDWSGLGAVLNRLPPIREKVRDMSHCLSDCWTQLDNTQRLLSTLTEASQWCDVVSSSSPLSSPSSPLSSLPPIPPSRFQDARALAMELGGGALLELWAQTLERYQRTLAHFKTRVLQAERGPPAAAQGQEPGSGTAKTSRLPSSGSSSLWELEGEVEGDWGNGGEGGLQSWGSLASVFRPQNCSTLKIGEEKKKEAAGGTAGGGKFLQNLLNPSKKSPTDAPLPPKPPRKRHPSFDLQALLAPRRAAATVTKPAETPLSSGSRASPLSWLGRKAVADPILTAGMAAALPGWKDTVGGGAGGGVLIRGVEVSSKEVADHTGLSRQHVLLGRTEREMGGERPGTTAQSKLYLQWCRLVSSERQYVALLKAVEENYLPLLDSTDAPPSLRGKAESLFSNWSSLAAFHSQSLLPAMEGALSQTLQQTDCFNKFRDQFLQYSHYIRTKPELDSLLVSQAADFFKAKLFFSPALATVSFPQCLSAPTQRLQHYCEILEELGGLNPAPDSALSVLRHTQRHGEDLRASDLITGCPVPVAERGELVRQGELCVCVCVGGRRKKTGMRNVFLYQHCVIFTKHKTPSPGRSVYSFKHCIKTGEMGLTQSVGEEGLRFEVWVRQASRTKDCLTLQAASPEDREAWTHDIAQLLWTHAIHNTELCLKESLCMGVSSKLLLDVAGTQASELDSSFSLNDRVQSSCSDSSSVGSQKEGGSPAVARDPKKSSAQTGQAQNSSPSTSV
ncbi:pleckstrin homology domain-containing family G member 4B [Colossoma macropomum]|uniref:pleckstrin homology domain-containing family G member 4B n=1 Tax=Colossoma macropomum TaxID=42526 RepID=UPI001863C1FD|nr:pleckstrin homology domain-containing family G member 4B [Colossoma macropomum]